MIVLNIRDLQLDDQVDHIATDWQVSRTLAFNDLVIKVTEDHVNLRNIVFDEILDPNIKYYARARALLSTGYTTWGNLDVFTPKTINDLNETLDLPSRIAIPAISTSSSPSDHDATNFTIYATGYSVVGTASHIATTWVIEDLNGNVVWEKLSDPVNKSSIKVTDILLDEDKIYRIRVMFHSNTHDASQPATKTIHVKSYNKIVLNSTLDEFNALTDNKIDILPYEENAELTWEILYYKDGNLFTAYRETTAGNQVLIPASKLIENSSYILKITSNASENSKFIPFTTYAI
jgi:hypothetical protein